jgi:branched-chain amino acid transport system permease protein
VSTSTVGAGGRRPGGPTRSRELLSNPHLRFFAGWVAAGVVAALVTSPEGRTGQPMYAISQAFHPRHLLEWLGVALVGAAISFAWRRGGGAVRPVIDRPTAQARQVWQDRRVRYASYVVLLALAAFLPAQLFGQYWQQVLVDSIGIYALLAIGLNVVVGFAGLLDLGYIAFYAIGAYATAYFTDTLPVHPPFTLNPFLVLPLAVLAAMIAGLVLGAPTLRLRGDYLAIVTLGFGEIITILAVNLNSVTNGARGAFGLPTMAVHIGGLKYDFGNGNTNLRYYYLLLAFTVLILVLFHLLEDSRVGRAWTAIREDEVAAQACGIPPVKYKLLAFAIGASTSGFAGVLYATKISYINPSDFTVSFSILVLVLVIFGGMGSLAGSIAGAVAVQGFFALVLKHNWFDPADLYIYVGAVLIIMMIFRPQGIVPSRRRAREIGLAEVGIGGADATGAPQGSPTS